MHTIPKLISIMLVYKVVHHITLYTAFLVAHFPLPDCLSVLAVKAGLLNQDFRLATTCYFDGRSFPSKYCLTSDFGSTGSTSLTQTLAFRSVVPTPKVNSFLYQILFVMLY